VSRGTAVSVQRARLAWERLALTRLARDTRGAPALEFAMVAPVFLLLMLGVANVGQLIYAKILLNGAVEQAARTSATENGDTTAADNTVQKIVGPIVPGATFTTTRYRYYDFTDVGRAEKSPTPTMTGTATTVNPTSTRTAMVLGTARSVTWATAAPTTSSSTR